MIKVLGFHFVKDGTLHAHGWFGRSVNISDHPGMVAEYDPETQMLRLTWPGHPQKKSTVFIHVSKLDSLLGDQVAEPESDAHCICPAGRHKSLQASKNCPNKG